MGQSNKHRGEIQNDATKLINKLTGYQELWSGRLGMIKAENPDRTHRRDPTITPTTISRGPTQRVFEKKEIYRMLKEGVIEPSTSQKATPVVFAPKK